MKRGLDAQVAFERIQMPHILTFEGSRYALLLLSDVRSEMRMLIAPLAEVLAEQAHWMPVAGLRRRGHDVAIDGETLYLLANKGPPRGRVLKATVQRPAIARATEVVPQGEWVIEDLHLARDGLYLRMLDGGISRLKRLARDGQLSEIALPFDGTLSALNTTVQHDGGLFSLTGWLTPADIWSVDAAGHVTATGLTPKPAIDVSPYESKRLFATARDGTRVPYTSSTARA